jgi:hypothetical protein
MLGRKTLHHGSSLTGRWQKSPVITLIQVLGFII